MLREVTLINLSPQGAISEPD